MPAVPSLALGAGEVTLTSMTAAYAAFAAKGIVRTPVLVRRVLDSDGTVLNETIGHSQRAMNENTAFIVANMLTDVINAGTGARARAAGFRLPAAGKTGTTNEYRDAWFVGFTPTLVTGVWIGFDQPKTIISGGYAGEIAVPVWADIMKEATKGDAPRWLEKPDGVNGISICRVSGKLAGEGCEDVEVMRADGSIDHRSMVYTEFFVRGSEPDEACDLHDKPNFFERVAGGLGGDSNPAPVPAAQAGGPAAPAAGSPQNAPSQAETAQVSSEDEKPKKRGFWSRLFGVGKKDDKKDGKKDDKDEAQKVKPPRPPTQR